MKNKIFLRFIILALLFFMLNAFVSAEFVAPPSVVNNETKQCLDAGELFGGDECTVCSIEGVGQEWKPLDSVYDCPAEYELIGLNAVGANYSCKPLKGSFCCTAGHSGSAGDCKDLVVNNQEKKCAFVEDISKCGSFPIGWSKASGPCPQEYKWVEDWYIQCSAKPINANQNYLMLIAGIIIVVVLILIFKKKKFSIKGKK